MSRLWRRLLDRVLVPFRSGDADSPRRRILFETLEPRLLLSATPTVLGTLLDDNDFSGNPGVHGTLGNDIIDALAGDDTVYGDGDTGGSGAGGDDVIVGGDGWDQLLGEGGNDWIEPGPMPQPMSADQTVDGGDGDDTLFLLGAPTDYQFFDAFGGGFIAESIATAAPEGRVVALGIEHVAFGVHVLDYADGTAQPLALVDAAQVVPGFGNRAPIAVADSVTGGRGATEILIGLPALFANDTDLDGDAFQIAELLGAPGVTVEGFDNDPLTLLPDVPPEHAADFPDGLVRVRLDAPLTALRTFDYRLADAATGLLSGNSVTVTIRPSALPTAANDAIKATIGRDTVVAYETLLANDSSGLTFVRIVPDSIVVSGSAGVEDYGSGLRITSFDQSPATLTFTYEARDAFGNVASAGVSVEVVNRAPIVADSAALVTPGGSYTLRFADLAAFPATFDANGDALSMAFYSTAVPATVTLAGFEDRIEFTFAADYAGDYVLDFALADATGAQDAGRFRFLTTAPAAPVAVADALPWGISTASGEAFGTFSLSRLLANDAIAPGVKVYADFSTVAQPAHGTFYVEPGSPNSVVPTTDPLNLMLSYVPQPFFIGTDTVTYDIVDEFGRRSTTTLTFAVSISKPDVPAVEIAVPPGATSVAFPTSALFANATTTDGLKVSGYAGRVDADSGVLQATLDPVSGGYTSFTYTPDADTVLGQDAFFLGVLDRAAEGGSARTSTFVRFVRQGGTTVSIENVSTQFVEGTLPGAGGDMFVLFRRSGDLGSATTLTYALEADARPGASSAGADDLVDGFGTRSVTFDAGIDEVFVQLFASADRIHEADETFVVRMLGATGATIAADATRIVTITDDDAATSDLSLSSSILVGGDVVGVDEFGSRAGTTYTLRLVAENADGADLPADAEVRILFPDAAIDWRGLLPEDADIVFDPDFSEGHDLIRWHVGALVPGASAILDLQLASLLPAEVQLVAEVWDSTTPDFDSTPGNGAGAREDDSLAVVLYATPGDPPVARPDSFAIVEGATLTVPPHLGLLANDAALRGSTVSVSGNFPGVALTMQPDGGFTFVAPSGITGNSSYSYSYTVTDAFGQISAPAQFTFVVEDQPSPAGQSDTYVVFEGETLTVDALHGLLANDSPAPGTLLSSDELPALGALTLDFDGAFTYVAPASVAQDTPVTFHYVLIDEQGQQSLPIPVTILVANRQLFADVSVEVLPSQPVLDFGTTQQTVTVRVRNDGPSAVDDIRVDLSYENFAVVSATAPFETFSFDTGSGVWGAGPLEAGATAELVIIAATAAGGVGPRLTAEITQVRRSGEIVLDPDSTAGNGIGRGEDDEATGTWSVSPPRADLGVDVRGRVSTAISGEVFGATVEISNASALTVDNVVVQVSRSGYGGSAFTFNPSIGSFDVATGLWTIGTLEAAGSATLQFRGSSSSPGGQVFARILPATVGGIANQDPDGSNDRDTSSWRTDPARADLGVEVSGGGSGLIAGQVTGVTVTVANSSRLTVDDVVVEVSRFGYQASTFTPSIGSYDATTGLWTIGTLGPSGRATLVMSGRVGLSQQVIATVRPASVFGHGNQDPDNSNNRDVLSWSASPARADLGVDVSGPTTSVVAGRNVGTTVEVSNFSRLTVDDVVVQVTRGGYGGSSFTFNPSIGSYDVTTGLWTIGTLGAGGRATLQLSGSTGTIAGSVSASVGPGTVYGRENQDPDSSNNRDSVTWSVSPAREDLRVDVRRLSSTAPLVDQNVDVEVLVSNTGRAGLTTDNVVVQVSHTNYLAGAFTPSIGSYDAATGLWTVGTLAPGERATLQIAGSSIQAGPADVSASLGIATVLGYNNQDPVFANNADSESWTIPLPPRPSGLPDDYAIDEGVPLVVPATSGLLANDGQSRFTVVHGVTQPTIGTLTYQADGSFSYTPPRHVVGDQRATFVYTLQDASGQLSDPVEVAVLVRDVIAPADLSLAMQMVVGGVVQAGTAFGFDPGERFTVRLVARNAGPGDADGVIVRLPLSDDAFDVLGSLPEDADLVRDGSGYLWHLGTLAEGDEVTLDVELGALRRGTFDVSAEIVQSASPDPDSTPGNGAGEDDEARFTVDVENAPPVAVGDRYTAEPGAVLVVNGSGVLGNDTDANGDALILDLDALDTTGLQGDLTFISADGGFQFRPADGFTGTTSFRYGVTDLNGAVTLGTVTIDVIPRPLRVTSFAQTDSGVHLGFDQSLALARINLYGTTGTTTGAADVTLVGAATGAVRGSLVVDADGSGFNFVKTGGVLAPDTYTLTLRSGAEGVVSGFGGLLDGDANGTAGDAHVRMFTVQAGGGRVLSLPDFMRAPGQDVVVPNTATGGLMLPVRLSDGTGVQRVRFDLRYDAGLLDLVTALPTDGHGADIAITAVAGGVHVDVQFAQPLPAGAVTVLNLVTRVPTAAVQGQAQVLDLANVELFDGTGQATAARADDAIQQVGLFMDTDGDGTYSRADVDALQRVIAGLDTGFSAWRSTDPVIVGDLNGSGSLTSLDASRLLVRALGGTRPEIPALPAVVPQAPPAPSARLAATLIATAAGTPVSAPGHVDWSARMPDVVLPAAAVAQPTAIGTDATWKATNWAKDLGARLKQVGGGSNAKALLAQVGPGNGRR